MRRGEGTGQADVGGDTGATESRRVVCLRRARREELERRPGPGRNPFREVLLEACMDLSHTDAVVAIQDGAAGLTSAWRMRGPGCLALARASTLARAEARARDELD